MNGGYPRHPLNELLTNDKVYVEALFKPTEVPAESAMGVHLARNGITLFSRDYYYKEHRKNTYAAFLTAIATFCWLLYQLNKHCFHYRHLKKKKRFNESLPA